MKIAYQGVAGSYSESCAKEKYPDCETIPCKTFDECFEKANNDSLVKAIIPESNKTTGNIDGRLTMKFQNNWKIIYSEMKEEKKQNSIMVPPIYSLPFAFHLKNSNTLSKILKKKFKIDKNYRIKIKNKKINFIFNKRNKLINDNIELLIMNNIFKGLYKFGWFLNKNAKEI